MGFYHLYYCSGSSSHPHWADDQFTQQIIQVPLHGYCEGSPSPSAIMTLDGEMRTENLHVHESCECAIQSLLRLEMETYYAMKDRDLAKLERIMNSGLNANHCFSESVPIDAQNGTILELGVQENFQDYLRLVLFHRPETLTEITVQAAFTYAMKHNMLEIVRLFLQAVTEDRIPMELASAFRHAVCKDQYDLVAKLIKKPRFDVNLKATWGLDRPLHIVMHRNQTELVQQLLEYNAVVDVEDRKGVTPLIVACCYSAVKCVHLLLQHGANPGYKTGPDPFIYHSPLQATFRFSINADTTHSIVALLIRAGLNLRSELWVLTKYADKINPQTKTWMKNIGSSPQPLKNLSFVLIRKNLLKVTGGVSILKTIDKLPIAPALKNYLKMEDVHL